MERVEIIDETLFVENREAVLPDQNKLRMGDDEFLTVSRAKGKVAKSADQPLFQFLHIHRQNLREPWNCVKERFTYFPLPAAAFRTHLNP